METKTQSAGHGVSSFIIKRAMKLARAGGGGTPL